MAARLFFWTVVFDIILSLQGCHADDTCDPGNGENILITNMQNWEDLLQRDDVKNLIKQLENDESVSRIHFNFNIGEPEKTGSDDKGTLCVEEWHKASDGHCYKLFKEKLTFHAAFDNCRKQLDNTATLAIGIRNLTIRSEINKTLHLIPKNEPRQIWIGLKQAKSGGKWYWADRTVMASASGTKGWRIGEPSNHSNEDCGALDSNHEFHFGDFECSKTAYYICESAQGYNRSAIDSWG